MLALGFRLVLGGDFDVMCRGCGSLGMNGCRHLQGSGRSMLPLQLSCFSRHFDGSCTNTGRDAQTTSGLGLLTTRILSGMLEGEKISY